MHLSHAKSLIDLISSTLQYFDSNFSTGLTQLRLPNQNKMHPYIASTTASFYTALSDETTVVHRNMDVAVGT